MSEEKIKAANLKLALDGHAWCSDSYQICFAMNTSSDLTAKMMGREDHCLSATIQLMASHAIWAGMTKQQMVECVTMAFDYFSDVKAPTHSETGSLNS